MVTTVSWWPQESLDGRLVADDSTMKK